MTSVCVWGCACIASLFLFVCLALFWFVCVYCFFKDACLLSMRERERIVDLVGGKVGRG